MSNLPAGFAITSIDGLRCTAVPRSATVLTGSLAAEAATLTIASSSTAATETAATISSNSQAPGISPNAGSAPSSPDLAPAIPTSTTSASPVVTKASSATADLIPTPRVSTGPIVGGVVGSAALIGLLGLLFFLFRRRRRGRESLLTPLTTGRRNSFYDNDDMSVGPTGRGQKWKNNLGFQTDRIRDFGTGIKTGLAGIGASVKSKVGRDRSDTPNVDLNRGNSQFLDGPIPQHSRNNSVLSSNGEKVSLKEKAADFFDKIKESSVFNIRFGKKAEPADPFATARGMTEKQANSNGAPDFSQLLGMEDRDLQLQAERRRASFTKNTNSIPQLGSLGLDFGSIEDPFADPAKNSSVNNFSTSKAPNAKMNPFADPAPSTTRRNPFADPARPEPTMPKPNTYIAAIRRSRGQSVDNPNPNQSGYRPPSTAVGSRYPSSIAPSRDSYRDTVFSSFSANARKGKGRSDPFDLERPDLWSSRENSQGSNMYPNPLNPNGAGGNPNPLRMSSVKNIGYGTNTNKDSRIMSTASYASKYSSGISSLGNEWGDPGPDLGPGSSSSSMRGNAGSNGGSVDLGMGSNRAEEIKKWDDRRGKDNVSPVSKTSSKNGVGKAM